MNKRRHPSVVRSAHHRQPFRRRDPCDRIHCDLAPDRRRRRRGRRRARGRGGAVQLRRTARGQRSRVRGDALVRAPPDRHRCARRRLRRSGRGAGRCQGQRRGDQRGRRRSVGVPRERHDRRGQADRDRRPPDRRSGRPPSARRRTGGLRGRTDGADRGQPGGWSGLRPSARRRAAELRCRRHIAAGHRSRRRRVDDRRVGTPTDELDVVDRCRPRPRRRCHGDARGERTVRRRPGESARPPR